MFKPHDFIILPILIFGALGYVIYGEYTQHVKNSEALQEATYAGCITPGPVKFHSFDCVETVRKAPLHPGCEKWEAETRASYFANCVQVTKADLVTPDN